MSTIHGLFEEGNTDTLGFETLLDHKSEILDLIAHTPNTRGEFYESIFRNLLNSINPMTILKFEPLLSGVRSLFSNSYSFLKVFVDFLFEHREKIFTTQELSREEITKLYATLDANEQKLFSNPDHLLRLIKVLFFDISGESEKVIIKKDFLVCTLFIYRGYLSSSQEYTSHFFYHLGQCFLETNTPTKKLYASLITRLSQNKSTAFYQLVKSYQPKYSQKQYEEFSQKLSDGFKKELTRLALAPEISLDLSFCSEDFAQFFQAYKDDFFLGLQFGIFFTNAHTLYIDPTFHSLFFAREELIPQTVTLDQKKYDLVIENTASCEDLEYRYQVYQAFFETENINKKQIPFTKKEVSDFIELIDGYVPNSFSETIAKIWQNRIKSLIPYKKYVGHYLGNINRKSSDTIRAFSKMKSFDTFFAELIKKYDGQLMTFDDFMALSQTKYPNLYITLQKIQSVINYEIGNRIYPYTFTMKALFNNTLLELARMGIIDVYCTKSTGEYDDNYKYTKHKETYEYFQIEYIRFKSLSGSTENHRLSDHITGNTIYLTPDAPLDLVQLLAQCTILEKIDTYIVLTLNRETIIKANNHFQMQNSDILELLTEDFRLSLPKNISLMLSELARKTQDLTILPKGIPVVVSEEGTYQDLLKLKMFSKYIIYQDDTIRLIVFSPKFTGLGSLLTKRNLIIQTIETK